MADALLCLVSSPAPLTPSGSVFSVISGCGVTSATALDEATTLRSAGVYSKLSCKVVTSGTSTITLITKKNAGSGSQTLSVSTNATGSFSDNTHTDTVAAADKLYLGWTLGAGTAPVVLQASMLFAATTNTARRLICSGSNAYGTAAATSWFNALEGNIASVTLTEAETQFEAQKAATAQNLAVICKTKGRGTGTTVGFRKNGVSSPTVSVVGTGAIVEQTSTAITIAAGDLVNFITTTGTGAGTDTITWTVIDWTTTDGSTIYPTDTVGASAIGPSTTVFCGIIGAGVTSNATESVIQNAFVATNFAAAYLQCEVSANSISAASTIKFRKNAADGVGTASITSNTTGIFQDVTGNLDALTSDDLICASLVTGGSGTSLTAGAFGFTAINNSGALTQTITGEQIAFSDAAATDLEVGILDVTETTKWVVY